MAKSTHENPPALPNDDELENDTHEPTGESLKYNEEEDSFELDSDAGDTEYDHPLPYDTAAPNGEDDNSTYDEENPYAQNEYENKESDLPAELDELDDVVADESVQLDIADEELVDLTDSADTAEDPETDAEGYPLRDDAGGDDNPISSNPA